MTPYENHRDGCCGDFSVVCFVHSNASKKLLTFYPKSCTPFERMIHSQVVQYNRHPLKKNIGIAVRYFSFHDALTVYFCKASFPLYVFHLPWVVAVAYVCIPRGLHLPLQTAVILLFSFLFTILTYEATKRVPVLRVSACAWESIPV